MSLNHLPVIVLALLQIHIVPLLADLLLVRLPGDVPAVVTLEEAGVIPLMRFGLPWCAPKLVRIISDEHEAAEFTVGERHSGIRSYKSAENTSCFF